MLPAADGSSASPSPSWQATHRSRLAAGRLAAGRWTRRAVCWWGSRCNS